MEPFYIEYLNKEQQKSPTSISGDSSRRKYEIYDNFIKHIDPLRSDS